MKVARWGHDDFDSVGPDPATIVRYILDTYPEGDLVEAMNAYFFSLDPEKHWPNFATLVTTDEHDDASDLDRPGVFRLNLGVDRPTFEQVAAAVPDPDFRAFDTLLPHPVYGQQLWSRSSTRRTRRSSGRSCRSSDWHTIDSPTRALDTTRRNTAAIAMDQR